MIDQANKYTNVDIASEFRIFGFLEMKYNIDNTDLRKKYQLLQLKWHPDKSGQSEMSVQISLAYQVLVNNLTRAKLILDFYNIAVPQPTPQQLEKWMKYFEIAQIDSSGMDGLISEQESLTIQLSSAFFKWESGHADLMTCANIYLEVFYLGRLLENIA
jgi:curved DNA-binding protein CbpA